MKTMSFLSSWVCYILNAFGILSRGLDYTFQFVHVSLMIWESSWITRSRFGRFETIFNLKLNILTIYQKYYRNFTAKNKKSSVCLMRKTRYNRLDLNYMLNCFKEGPLEFKRKKQREAGKKLAFHIIYICARRNNRLGSRAVL